MTGLYTWSQVRNATNNDIKQQIAADFEKVAALDAEMYALNVNKTLLINTIAELEAELQRRQDVVEAEAERIAPGLVARS